MKNIVITGGTNGIGAASVTRLLKQSCRVYVLDTAAPDISSEWETEQASFIYTDLASPTSIDETIKQLPDKIDVLINVAGISGAHPVSKVLSVNFLGLRHLTQALFSRLSGGCVVNVASSAGRDWLTRKTLVHNLLDTSNFEEGLAWIDQHTSLIEENPYKFSKQCAAAYTYRAAGLGMAYSVRVNCVNPGVVGTRLTADFKDMLGSDLYEWVVKQIGREGRPDDIAQIIEFLSIGESFWLNGVEIAVDGGYTAGVIDGWIKPPQ